VPLRSRGEHKRKLSSEQRVEAVRRYDNGESPSAIARDFHDRYGVILTGPLILYWAREASLDLRPRGAQRKYRFNSIMMRLRDGSAQKPDTG
jgi:hypothetical protein